MAVNVVDESQERNAVAPNVSPTGIAKHRDQWGRGGGPLPCCLADCGLWDIVRTVAEVSEPIRARRERFGCALKTLRESRGESQAGAAAAIGMDRSYYAGVEAGRHSVTLDKLLTIADHFEVSPASLLERI